MEIAKLKVEGVAQSRLCVIHGKSWRLVGHHLQVLIFPTRIVSIPMRNLSSSSTILGRELVADSRTRKSCVVL